MLYILKKIIPYKVFKTIQPIYHYIISFLAAICYGFPGRKLIIIGVTGTAGKTSSVYFIAKVLQSAGYKVGFTSTSIFSLGEKEILNDKKMTMPGRFFIQHSLRQMLNNACQFAIIETTSEGIKQFRHCFIDYDVLVFTNLYPEHIESHGSFEKYKKAKGKLFKTLEHSRTKYTNNNKEVVIPKNNLAKINLNRINKTIIVNGDDKEYLYFFNFWSEDKIVYTTQNTIKQVSPKIQIVKGQELAISNEGLKILINNQEINLHVLGSINLYNALVAASVALNQGLNMKDIQAGLESVYGLAGKMEKIELGQDYMVIVDYSFEPQALEKLYQTIGNIPHHNIIHVLGSTGGGRDKTRRPILGAIAGEKADYIIVTNEDPYNEDPQEIIDQVAQGAIEKGRIIDKNIWKILDRREAIQKAVDLANKEDIVVITGKGAEQYICIAGGKKIPWDDREEAKKAVGDKLCIDRK